MQRGEAVAKQYISMCLHSPRLQLLSPASSPAWSMPSPKGEGAEPCPSLQPSISVLGCGGPVAPWSFMGKCVCTRGKMEEPPAPHCVDEEGPTWCVRSCPMAGSEPGSDESPQPCDSQPFLSSWGAQLVQKISTHVLYCKMGLFFKICLLSPGFVNELSIDLWFPLCPWEWVRSPTPAAPSPCNGSHWFPCLPGVWPG